MSRRSFVKADSLMGDFLNALTFSPPHRAYVLPEHRPLPIDNGHEPFTGQVVTGHTDGVS